MNHELVAVCVLTYALYFAQASQPDSAQPAQSRAIVPDEQVQQHLERLAKTKRHTTERSAELLELWKLSRQPAVGRDHVLVQAAFYDSTHRGVSTLEPIMLDFGVDSYVIAHVLLPLYDTPDEKLRAFVWHIIGCTIGTTEMDARDVRVKAMLDYLGMRAADPPADLVRAVFYSAPTAAVDRLSMQWLLDDPAREEKRRSLLWTSHLVNDVVWKHDYRFLKPGEDDAAEAELEKLSRSSDWWVRLYVTQMLYRHDDILDLPKVRERLKNDPNELVAEAANDKMQRGAPPSER